MTAGARGRHIGRPQSVETIRQIRFCLAPVHCGHGRTVDDHIRRYPVQLAGKRVFLQDIRLGEVRGDDLEPFQFTAKGPAKHPLATGKHDRRTGHGALLSHMDATLGAVFPETHTLPVLARTLRP